MAHRIRRTSGAYADTRITTVFGGTTEIMKVIIARSVLGDMDR